MITRRSFINMFGLTVVAGFTLNSPGKTFGQTLGSDGGFLIPSTSMSDPVFSFTSAHFMPFINTDFEIRQEGEQQAETLRLLDVKEVRRKANLAKGVQGDSFSLMFSNTRGTKLAGDSFEFSHPSLGGFKLNLLPVSAEPNRYEAVINHLRL